MRVSRFKEGEAVIVRCSGRERTVARFSADADGGLLVQVKENNEIYQEKMLDKVNLVG